LLWNNNWLAARIFRRTQKLNTVTVPSFEFDTYTLFVIGLTVAPNGAEPTGANVTAYVLPSMIVRSVVALSTT
jgi:hypothetical protein